MECIGETIDRAELNRRHHHTAPYALQVRGDNNNPIYIDAATIRRVGHCQIIGQVITRMLDL